MSVVLRPACWCFAGLLAMQRIALAGDDPGQPLDSSRWLIMAERGVGPVDIFMTKDDVRSVLGSADVESAEGSWWFYERCGLTVIFGLDRPVVLELSGGLSPTGKELAQFRAKTAEGIGIGSWREDVIQRLGMPESDYTDSLGDEHVLYSTRLFVRIRDGKVAEVKIGPPRRVERKKPAASR
jgi:hypothetical protein